MKTTGFFSLMFLIISMFLCLPHTFAQEPTVLEHGGAVSSVAFSPVNPALVASAGGHETIRLWDLRNDTVVTLTGHTDTVNSVTFSPDGKWLASASKDHTLKVWDISQRNVESLVPITFRMPSEATAIVFHPDGQLVAASGRHAKLLDVINKTEIATLQHDEWVWIVAFSSDGRYLATDDHVQTTVKIWDVQEKQIIKILDGHTSDVNYVKFSPDNRTLASSAWGEDIKLWDVSNWERLGALRSGAAALDFSPDGKILASAGWEAVTLWSVETGEKIVTLRGHTGGRWIRGLAFSPDGGTLASGGGDGTVHIWDIEPHLRSPSGIVRLIYFLPSDRISQPDIDAKLDKLIKDAQQAFAEIMERHGFGRKTFQFETDASGKAIVHHVKGKFKDAYYHKDPWIVWEEIDAQFDMSNNIYLTALDISNSALCSRWVRSGSYSGRALIPASGNCFDVDDTAHVLGHTFGLSHDFRTNLKLPLSSYTSDRMIRSFCAAEWLDAHRYFNTGHTFFNEHTTFEMHPPRAVPPNDVHLRFEVTDPDGLHQAQLLTPEFEESGGLIACQRLNGTSSTVEFVVSQTIFRHSGTVTLRTIDSHGNFAAEDFYGDPQAGPKIEGPWVWMIVPTGASGGAQAATSGIDYLAQASGGAVTEKQVATHGATAGEVVGNKVWTPGKIAPTGDDNITELVNDIGLGEGDIDNYIAYGSIALDSPRLQETRMYVGSDDAVKVWLNGVLVHTNPIDRPAKDYQENFPVTLKQGTNILLVAAYEGGGYWSGFFGFDSGTEYTVLIPDATADPAQLAEDVNGDGVVNVQDLVLVASRLGRKGQEGADVNGDGVVNVQDLVLVAGAFGGAAAAPSLQPQVSVEGLTAADIQHLLTQARQLALTDPAYLRGIAVLEQLLAALIPKETTLLANYPNPFNPETWIPYQLAVRADVTVTIYAANGAIVRTLALGHQPAGMYQNRSRAAYWDGRNALGEPVASGVYFYTLTAGDFTATRKLLIRK